MPNIKSAKKRLKQSLVRRERNRSDKRTIRTECKKVVEAAKAGNPDLAETEFRTAVRKLDQAAAKQVIHRNAAARLKSRLSTKVKAAKGK